MGLILLLFTNKVHAMPPDFVMSEGLGPRKLKLRVRVLR